MALLRPFRQYHENDVINLFSFDALPTGELVVGRGHMVVIKGDTADDGWNGGQEFDLESINLNYPNTVSDRWNVAANIERANEGGLADAPGEVPLGMLLYDVREHDENGEKLIWHPRKYHEMQVALLGHAVPILTRGLVMIQGFGTEGGPAVPGQAVYSVGNGQLSTSPDPLTAGGSTAAHRVGTFLGGADNGNALMKLDVGL